MTPVNIDTLGEGYILVITDDAATLQMVTKILGDAGYTVRTAGTDDFLFQTLLNTPPELILINGTSTSLDRFAVCRQIKANEVTSNIPIIFTCTSEDDKVKKEGFQAGAVDYINKPFKTEEVLTRVRDQIALHTRLKRDSRDQNLAEREVRKLNRLLSVLLSLDKMMVRTRDEESLYVETCRILVEKGEFRMAWIGLINDETQTVEPAHWYGVEDDYLTKIKKIAVNNTPEGHGPTGTCIRERSYIYCNDIESDPRMALWREEALKRGYRSSIALPIFAKGNVIGALTIYSCNPFYFNESEIQLLEELTDNISYAVEMIRAEMNRNKAEDTLKTLRNVIEQSPALIIITTPDGSIEYVNPKFCEVTGYTFAEVVGRNPRFLKSGDKTQGEYQEIWNTILSGKSWEGEFHNKKKNGELYWISSRISSILDDDGNIVHFVAVDEDVTERKNIVSDLLKAKEKAEEMNRLKTAFLNNMSHELRTPLISILGFSEILEIEIKEPELKNMAAQINHGGKRLSETLNLILDLSQIEAEKLTVENRLFDLCSVIRQQVANYESVAKVKGLALTTVIKTESIILNADERMCAHIVDNLVNNAVKYTENGGITVILGRETGLINGKNEEVAVLKVVDTGMGIAEENFDIIFEEYRQVSEGLSRTFQGSGLGLTITKKFVEKMGGTLTVKSELKVGSVFTVTLPIITSMVQEPGTARDNTMPLRRKPVEPFRVELPRIMMVDDDPSAFAVTKIFLKHICKIEYASSGEEAIELAKKEKFTAILLDINLGFGIDGLVALKEIRKLEGYEKTPVLALTAYSMNADKDYFLEAGCDHYLSKPFRKAEIQKAVSEILRTIPVQSDAKVMDIT